MARSDATAALDYYAQQLSQLKDVMFPIHLKWVLPSGWGDLSVRTVYYRGKHHIDALGMNHYGDNDCLNQVYFFQVGEGYNQSNWQITILKWDDVNRPIEWLLNAPAAYRGGFPSDLEFVIRQLIEGLFNYAKDFLGYQVAETDDDLGDALGNIRDRIKARHKKDCDCDYCTRMMRVFSHRE
ncbi:hypothetical protein D3C81_237500 [compost metagenome]|jgi:hypothetical protein